MTWELILTKNGQNSVHLCRKEIKMILVLMAIPTIIGFFMGGFIGAVIGFIIGCFIVSALNGM